jgi:hypothetical protein
MQPIINAWSERSPRSVLPSLRATPKAVPVLWIGGAFGVALGLAVAVVSVIGFDPKGVVAALRLTARWSFLLFWMAYVGRSMVTLFGSSFAPFARRGREFGLAFASAHLVHLLLVVLLYGLTHHAPLGGWLLIFFSMGVAWTYLLAVLSLGTLSQTLDPRLWRALRVVGVNYILLAFAYDFVLPVLHSGFLHQDFEFSIGYVVFAAMCIAAPFLGLAAAAYRCLGPWQLAMRQGVSTPRQS